VLKEKDYIEEILRTEGKLRKIRWVTVTGIERQTYLC
jgi:hypothetical protein